MGLREYKVFVTEFDAQRMIAKVIIDGDDSCKRVIAQISTTSASTAENPYLAALGRYMANNSASGSCVTAKATVKNGLINKLFIVDIQA
ncbi:DUF7947 five-stranded beta-barrel domain-containing protein [Yersinia canariae]|uniref:DUF7947 five-stranded beta-barrel domain-containing protein n=1 Tax=Yersinia canariae TaxID=2607663 RepID=UPI004043BCCD